MYLDMLLLHVLTRCQAKLALKSRAERLKFGLLQRPICFLTEELENAKKLASALHPRCIKMVAAQKGRLICEINRTRSHQSFQKFLNRVGASSV